MSELHSYYVEQGFTAPEELLSCSVQLQHAQTHLPVIVKFPELLN